MPPVVIVDTSVYLNILNVPGFNQDRDAVEGRFRQLADDGANLLLPMGAIFETGNHIADVHDGRQRRRYATVFADQVRKALNGEAPWTLASLPEADELMHWLDSFPSPPLFEIFQKNLAPTSPWKKSVL